MARDTDTRAATLVDIPLVRRLTDKATVLDTEVEFTRDTNGPNGTSLSSILLPQRGLYTLVARSDQQQVIGQFRLRGDEPNAQIVYLAPELEEDTEDTAWLHILDAMAREAGKHNAHVLVAEVNEDSALFETMRTSGFAVYARQQIWRRLPGEYEIVDPPVPVSEATEADGPGIHALVCNTVPPLMQQIATSPSDLNGWIYRKNNRVEGYVAVSEGKNGIYLIPHLHPDIMNEATAVFAGVIQRIQKASKLPVYVRVRRHQDWIGTALDALQFEPGPRQAVMVKHIAAGVRHATFQPVQEGIKAIIGPLNPPNNHAVQHDPVVAMWKYHEEYLYGVIWNSISQTIFTNSSESCPVISTRHWKDLEIPIIYWK